MVSYILINILLELKDILVSNYGPHIGKKCINITKTHNNILNGKYSFPLELL